MFRVENKYQLSPGGMWELEKRISGILKPDPHNIDGKGYQISSLYFDDIHDTCLQDTIAGNPVRDKYRIRLYNDSTAFIQLEVKSKTYNWTKKHSTPISEDEMHQLINGETITVPSDMAHMLDNPRNAFNLAMSNRVLRPKIVVTYNRNAYICEAGNVRITFDYNLRASSCIERFGSSDVYYDYPADVPGYVLEVKYDEFIPDYILQLLETSGLLRTNNSKYAICRQIYQ